MKTQTALLLSTCVAIATLIRIAMKYVWYYVVLLALPLLYVVVATQAQQPQEPTPTSSTSWSMIWGTLI